VQRAIDPIEAAMTALPSVFLGTVRERIRFGDAPVDAPGDCRLSSGRMPANRVAPLVDREALGGAYFLLTFRHAETAREARPGQFVMIKAGVSAEPPLRRPFSILSVDTDRDTFTLFVKAVGHGSRALCEMAQGEVAACLGPLGRPFTLPQPGEEALLVAGGYGVAPFRFMGEALRRAGRTARLFYGGRTAADLPLLDRLGGAGLTLEPATEDGSLGMRGRVTVPLEAHLDAVSGRVRLYACGPEAMMQAVAHIAAARSLSAEVSLDPWMGCGLGTCLACVVRVQGENEPRWKYRCACTEGPVFDSARVVWPGEENSRARLAGVEGREGRP
jgi:dihydroorotate dehydrogenase electron transfer subunit